MTRLLSLLVVLLLLSGCQRYTVGAANAAPRVVSGNAEAAQTDPTEAAEEHSGEAEAHETDPNHSAALPEVDAAMVAAQEAFAHVRGSKIARHEAAESLESARTTLEKLAETGAISHWEDLDHSFETTIEKVTEGTNDAPNALNHLLEKLEKAGHH